ncbi:MAG: CRTAC1 family protein, partial [Myxococcota bacterium]
MIVAFALACRPPLDVVQTPGEPPRAVTDVALEAGFQDLVFGHHQRGRAALAADFDRDGFTDVYLGNPGDTSYVLRNTSAETGQLSFAPGPVIAREVLAWGGAVGDLDNDGDVDLFVAAGGNEAVELDRLFLNVSDPKGLAFVDVSAEAGIQGPVQTGAVPAPWTSTGANLVDADNDGDLDVFVNSFWVRGSSDPRVWRAQNLLWRNDGAGAFTQVGAEVGFDTQQKTMNSTWLDVDLDGDLDLFENNFQSENHLFVNRMAETGRLSFEDRTAAWSIDGDLRYPHRSFSSATADLNRDGYPDLVCFVRPYEPDDSPHRSGHIVFLNVEGRGFVDLTEHMGLNDPFVNWTGPAVGDGVMGSQVGDLNLDGIPDLFIGNGTPANGTVNALYLSTGELRVRRVDGVSVAVPQYRDATALVDVPAPQTGGIDYAPYPYRTHGTVIVDFDQDGVPELAVNNGGPGRMPTTVREPNRLFVFDFDVRPAWWHVTLEGDGERVNRSAIGARVTVTVERDRDGASWIVRRWLQGGSGFAANEGLELLFGLADADRIVDVEVVWP